jgi:hypothetical protein
LRFVVATFGFSHFCHCIFSQSSGTFTISPIPQNRTRSVRRPRTRAQYDFVREELGETIHLNETLYAPSARAMEKLLPRSTPRRYVRRAAGVGASAERHRWQRPRGHQGASRVALPRAPFARSRARVRPCSRRARRPRIRARSDLRLATGW